MSRTVCSWCQNPLVLKDDILVCSNTDCPACDEKYLHEELMRTRKALEIASAENIPGPIKLYVCADGSVYDNEDVAKSHAASIFNPLPAGATTTDRVYLERELDRTKKQIEIAVDGIKYMRNNCLEYAADYMDKADEILEQITELEQKDK